MERCCDLVRMLFFVGWLKLLKRIRVAVRPFQVDLFSHAHRIDVTVIGFKGWCCKVTVTSPAERVRDTASCVCRLDELVVDWWKPRCRKRKQDQSRVCQERKRRLS